MNKTSDVQKESSNETTADILVQKLIDWGVTHIFGIIGDRINPIVESLRKQQNKIKFITVRHEETAALMACGYAKYTGKLGVCLATSGPGALHLVNGLYDAYKDHAPVLAITGAPVSDLAGTDYTQEIDTVALFQEVAVYNQYITGPHQAKTVVDLAIRASLTSHGVAHLKFAKDTQQETIEDDTLTKGTSKNFQGSVVYSPRIEVPVHSELEEAAAILANGKKIGILVGYGARGCGELITQMAELLKAPVAKALMGKAVIPDDSPYCTGGTGHLGTLPSKEWMEECDTLLILGSNMPYLDYYPEGAVAIQVDHEPTRIGLRYPVQLGLIGDMKPTLTALLPLLKENVDDSFLKRHQEGMTKWRQTLKSIEEGESDLVRPQYLVAEVARHLDEDAIVSLDTGANTIFTARHWELKQGQSMAVSGNLASMGVGLPYAMAAQLAFPERQCIAMVGDGGLAMLMADIATAVRYQLPVKIIVFKNNSLSLDVYEQRAAGDEEFGGDLTPIDFAEVAKACGAAGYICKSKRELPAILQETFKSSVPTVIEVWIDPEQAPSSPDHITQNIF
jgi:pyruvate dehydrogenase (quinone)